MKSLKGILFDFNGTLLFDSDMHMEAFRQVFPLYGHPVPSDEFMIQRCFGRTNETIYKENFDPNATAEDFLEFERRKEALYHELCLSTPERFRLVDGAAELLRERWTELREEGVITVDAIMENAEAYWKLIHASGAIARECGRWSSVSYANDLMYFESILEQRIDWLDEYIQELE